MLNRLTARWQYITALYESGELGEDINDTQEVVEDMLNRTLTREYLDVLKVALVGATITSPLSERDNSSGALDNIMDQDDHSMDIPAQTTRATQSALAAEVISDLGAKLLRNPGTCDSICLTILRYVSLHVAYLYSTSIFFSLPEQQIFINKSLLFNIYNLFIYSAVSWNDTSCSYKAVLLTGPLVRFLAMEDLLTSALATNILLAVLQGLQVHGQHEANQVRCESNELN